jgi:ATP-binding cassette subfamily C protein
LAASRLVCERLGIDVRPPAGPEGGREVANPLEEIAKASRFALRRVELRDGWHRQDGGPLLGFVDDGETPVALLPASKTSYELCDVADGTTRPVTPEVAARLMTSAFMFYRCLPDGRLRGRDLACFAARGTWSDLLAIILVGSAGGLVTLLAPVAIGHVFDVIIPSGERGQLVQITLGLVVVAYAIAAFQVTRNIALIRLKHGVGDALQAAVWERVVNLPVRFFRKYSAGDLGTRAMGIDTIMDELSSSMVATIVSAVFSLFAIGLMFWYSPPTAAVAVGLVLLLVVVVIICGTAQVRYEGRIEELNGRMAGMLLQFMNGVAKLRITAAEDRAFSRWATRFAVQRRLEVKSAVIDNGLDVLFVSFPVLSSIVIFWLVAGGGGSSAPALSTGGFLAFVAAFATLEFGMIRLGSVVVGALAVVPIYNRLKPILQTAPEIDVGKADPGPLRGRVEVSNLSFRYDPDGPLILKDVSFDAQPGEFIALVGPSGSGKSTLLRLLLGFEQPESGTITYDGYDLAGLDPWRLRRQLGVVLQDSDLQPGDMFSNIVGSAVDLTIDDAWEAARLAGFERDIERLPMGMHTVITEALGTLSGGERQRLLIARALVARPRIVLFDEATSALDNPTQAVVTESLDRLRATRVVIAHRLSTVLDAERIFVLDGGRIVQSGTHHELISQPGLFRDLVKRQIA